MTTTSTWRSRWLSGLLTGLLVYMAASQTSVVQAPESTSSLIVCSVDGGIYTLDAYTGMAKGFFGTGRPLVEASSPYVVPGLDGHIYSLQQDDVQVLPMTVHQVVQHPVQTCSNSDSQECGIVTGTKLTYLYALDPVTGRLEWTQQYGKADDDEDEEESRDSASLVVLQRQDYIVRHISALTGEEVWNVTLGYVSALDFSPPVADYLPGRVEESEHGDSMPLIAFGNDGMTITAMDPDKNVLWKRRLNTVIASVYGAVGNGWVPLTVTEEKEKLDAPDNSLVPLLSGKTPKRDLYLELLWREVKNMATADKKTSDMVIYQPPRLDSAREMNRLSHKRPRVCTGDSVNGVCQGTMLLLGSGKEEEASKQGLFLTYNMVGGILVLILLMGFGLRVLYAHKKRQWMAQQRKEQRSNVDRYDLSLPLRPTMPLRPRELVRSASLPVFGGQKDPAPISPMSHHGKVPLVRNSTAPTAADTFSSQSMGNIDGIPLVRYSRYKSEFREIAPLGKGGFGSVFQCENALDGREYAMKKVWIPSSDEGFSQRLHRVLREVKILALLDHPNIVRYYTAWLELEDENDSPENDTNTEDAKTMTKCFSSELLTGLTSSDARRLSPTRSGRPLYKSPNPLGWSNFGIDLDSEDIGFHFERSSSSLDEGRQSMVSSSGLLPAIEDNTGDGRDGTGNSSSSSSSDDGCHSSFSSLGESRLPADEPNTSKNTRDSPGQKPASTAKVRHTLYIQMQLCSQKTLGDFLSNEKARKGTAGDTVDIPLALSLFHQIAQGVKYVHQQGLIHRDLKPSNCFIDDAGVVKVGDFGLSRESGDIENSDHSQWLGGDDDNTAGVGTRSYASPEQMKGSDYGASTDLYSLGVILFEMCYPMCTVSRGFGV